MSLFKGVLQMNNKPFTQESIVKLVSVETKQTNSSMICKCHRNYGKFCKKIGGCVR